MSNPRDVYFEQQPGRARPRDLVATEPSPLKRLRQILVLNQDLLRNAGSLAATTGLTSILGFGFWYYAARVFSPNVVGYATAAVSSMTLLGTIGMFGLGTMLIGELPRGGKRGELMTASLIASFVGSFVLGLGFALVTLAFGKHFVYINGNPSRVGIFAFGVAMTGVTFVFDDATIGLMRGGLQLSRNMAFSIVKMAALPAMAFVMHDAFGVGITTAWVLGIVVSLIPVAITIKRTGSKIFYRPDWGTFWRLRKVTWAHNWLNLAITTPGKLIPVLVSIVVASPKENAAYYVAAMMTTFLFMVPTHLSTVLFAIASATPEKIPEKLRFVLRMSLVVGIPAGLVLGICAPFILSRYGPTYVALATGPVWIAIVGYLPALPNTVYIAVCRATGRIGRATVFISVFAVIQMISVVVGGKIDGLYGLSYGMLAVGVIEACISTPRVLRAAFGSTSLSMAAEPVTAGQARLRVAGHAEEVRLRQEAGLVALIALATTVAPSPPRHGPRAATAAQTSSDTTASAPGGSQRQQGSRGHGRHTRAAVQATAIQPVLDQDTWLTDADEATFRARQEAGMAALIAIATHAARF